MVLKQHNSEWEREGEREAKCGVIGGNRELSWGMKIKQMCVCMDIVFVCFIGSYSRRKDMPHAPWARYDQRLIFHTFPALFHLSLSHYLLQSVPPRAYKANLFDYKWIPAKSNLKLHKWSLSNKIFQQDTCVWKECNIIIIEFVTIPGLILGKNGLMTRFYTHNEWALS